MYSSSPYIDDLQEKINSDIATSEFVCYKRAYDHKYEFLNCTLNKV